MRILTLHQTLMLIDELVVLFKTFSKGFDYNGDYKKHPIFQNFFDPDSYQRIAGFDTWWMKKYEWLKVTSNNYEEEINAEVVMIRAAPENISECLTEIHFHGGKVVITVMGETYNFPTPQTTLFRGLAKLHNIFNHKNTKFHMEYFQTEDNGKTLISDYEPHGFYTKFGTETFAFAVTVGPPFKDTNGIVDATIVSPENCLVITRDKKSLLEFVSFK